MSKVQLEPQVVADVADTEPGSESIKTLTELCKAGKLFAIQEWISSGNPVDPQKSNRKRSSARSPLDVAIERGFHSLVEVLLKAGATINLDPWNGSMARALRLRRFDLIRLLVEHGYDPASVDIGRVFESWDPEIMEFFIDRGADVSTGNPLASALCNRIRTALRLFKRYRDQIESFQEQANIALRYHCREGNLKWVSLMLWAGADPLARGPDRPEREPSNEDDGGLNALEFAALYEHFEVLKLKQIRLSGKQPSATKLARRLWKSEAIELLTKLLDTGMEVNDLPNGGSSLVRYFLSGIDWIFAARSWENHFGSPGIDSSDARDRMSAIRLVAERGARWVPEDRNELSTVRRSFLKLRPEFVAEFVLIMTEFRACDRSWLEELLRTPSMKKHTEKFGARLARMIDETK